jgi:hypothetical protein
MITDKIKNLFRFIEYLHSNIENFNQHIDLINELWLLGEERKELRPEKNYKDKQQYVKIQEEISIKFDELQDKTANHIRAKAKELNVCNFDEKDGRLNEIATDIDQLKNNFSTDDLSEIFKHKNQYIEFRKNDYCYFLSLYYFFFDLDRRTKDLFDYFKEPTAPNEYEAFETKVIQVNNEKEAFKLLQQGGLRAFNINPLNPSITPQQTNIEPLPPKPPQPLQTNLTTDKRARLFIELVKGEFIPDENPDCFNWAIGVTDEKEPKQPGQWQPIEWKEAKTGLREFLTLILGKITNQHCRDIEQLFRDNKGDQFKMPKPKKGEYSARCNDIETIISNLGIIKNPTTPDQL